MQKKLGKKIFENTHMIGFIFFLIGILTIFISTSGMFHYNQKTNNSSLSEETSLAAGYVPLAPLPGISDGKIGGIGEYLNIIFQWMIAIAVVAAVLMIIFGGVQYMTTDAVFAKAEGLKKIQSAVGGLLLALVSWLILNTINPDILNIEIKLENQDLKEGGLSVDTSGGIPGYVNIDNNNPEFLPGSSIWGADGANTFEGQTIDARFTYYSSTEATNDSNTIAGKNAIGGRLVDNTGNPFVVGSAASNYYPPGTIISKTGTDGQTYYHVIDDNNIGASNNNLNNSYTFDIYNSQRNPAAGNPDNGKVNIVYVPKDKLSNSTVQSLHDYKTMQDFLYNQKTGPINLQLGQ